MISGSNVFSKYVNLLRMLLVTKIVFVGLNVNGSIPSKYIHFVELGTLDINLSRPFDKNVQHLHFYLFIY